MEQFKLSLLIPAVPGELYLARCLRHIVYQDLADVEVILVFDGPGEISPEEAYWLSRLNHQILRTETQLGAGAARNLGLSKATGSLIMFMDSDDRLVPGSLAKAFKFFKGDADIFLFSAIRAEGPSMKRTFPSWYLDTRGRDIQIGEVVALSDFDPDRLLVSSPAPWLRVLKKSLLDSGRIHFDESYRANDLGFFVRCMFEAEKVVLTGIPLVVYHARPGSLSSNKAEHAAARVQALGRVLEEFSTREVSEGFAKSLLKFSIRNFGGAMKDLGVGRYETLLRLLRSKPVRKFMRSSIGTNFGYYFIWEVLRGKK